MPRGRTAKSPKQKPGKPGRPKKYNRTLVLTAHDVLSCVRFNAGAGHPDDAIPHDAVIETRRVGSGFRYVVRWKGIPTDSPSYQGAYGPVQPTSA